VADECPHDDVEFEPGNHVPPFGWEIHPGYYCTNCGEMVDRDEPDEPDPDLARNMRIEMEQEIEQ
jgi:hypothetical protein